MRIRNIISVVAMAASRIYWCIKKGFPLRMAWCDIPFRDVPASTRFNHPYGITIAKGTILGENCVFASNVTIGWKRPFPGITEDSAVIGDRCFFGAGCVVLGPVLLPPETIVGANVCLK